MIVDDNPANLNLLEEMLTRQGHEVRSFPLGRHALEAAMRNPPDLILLDINMPEMNGYDVCERLKSIEELSQIPVIFLSVRNEIEDKVEAFRSGAVDYISKPFEFDEVHARVETHLQLRDLRRALELQNERLETAVAARTRELAEANERLTILDRSKNDFLNLISHELRTPLNGLLGVGELILELCSAEGHDPLQQMFEQSRRRILALVDDALLLTQIDVNAEQFRPAPVFLSAALTRAIENVAEFAGSRQVAFTAPASNRELVMGNDELLVRALHALLETAVKFSGDGETIQLRCEFVPDSVSLTVDTDGPTIPDSAVPRFFDLLSIGEANTTGGDLGLGPAVAYRILSLFGASVSVANRDPSGIRLTISLKRAARSERRADATLMLTEDGVHRSGTPH